MLSGFKNRDKKGNKTIYLPIIYQRVLMVNKRPIIVQATRLCLCATEY